MLGVLEVTGGKPNNWKRGEAEVKEHVETGVVDHYAGEERDEAIHEDRDSFQDILVEHVADGVGVAAVCFPTMPKEEGTQESELPNGVV